MLRYRRGVEQKRTTMAESKKPLSLWQRIARFFKIVWLQYQIVSATYMMEDWEARIYNTTILIVLCTATYTTYLYLPSHIMMIVTYLGYLFGTSDDASPSLQGTAEMAQAATN